MDILKHFSLVETCHSLTSRLHLFIKQILNKIYPDIITNVDLYKQTETKEWTKTIRKRRLTWFGHVLRMDKDTPARLALEEFTKPRKKRVGRPHNTWLTNVLKDIKENGNIRNIDLGHSMKDTVKNLQTVCDDRKRWTEIVRCMML